MDAEQVREHWKNWAEKYGTDTRATSYTRTLKELEIEALARRIEEIALASNGYGVNVLEVGCGNGINCVELAKRFSKMQFRGIDYVPAMITAARDNAQTANVQERVKFFAGDLFDLPFPVWNDGPITDIVITDRCLINL